MPQDRFIRITVDGEELDLGDTKALSLAISYALENRDNFQQKTSSTAFNVIVPATVNNDRIANTFRNPNITDASANNIFRSNRRGVIEINGQELLVGKVFLVSGHMDSNPLDYNFSFYGNNGDWIIDLKEVTLYDLLKDLSLPFTKAEIMSSWDFDGTDPNKPYVFAPVRYGMPLETYQTVVGGVVIDEKTDYNMKADYMKPALSKYWLIYRGLKSLGYKVKSDFFDTPYFRRQVMPWTWGSFLYSDGTELNKLRFLAKSPGEKTLFNTSFTGFFNADVSNESENGAFDDNAVYSWNAGTYEMTWTYPALSTFGMLNAAFKVSTFLDLTATANSDVEVRVQWFKNGVRVVQGTNDNGNGNLLASVGAPTIGRQSYLGLAECEAFFDVSPGDIITAKIYLHTFHSASGICHAHITVDSFELEYVRIPLGGTVNFSNLTGLKRYKFLDFLGGVIDEFDLCIQTDPVNKIVYLEPEHPYSLVHSQEFKSGGYFNGKILDWDAIRDLSKKSESVLYNDYDRELNFKYKDDTNDGSVKILQNRHSNTLALAKYVFPDRFKTGKKDVENRFFSVVVHYDVLKWKSITGEAPQMICLIPENVSSTSASESGNMFEPKSAYYKGKIDGMGWMFDGTELTYFPYMFAVNYKTGGENDPILSYCDEQIGPDPATAITGKGLLKRFYFQRLEIMRNGQYFRTYFKLNNTHIANFLHREHVIWKGERWELIEINNYKPISEDSTEVYLRKWSPIK